MTNPIDPSAQEHALGAEARSITIGGTPSAPELQGILVQLGRIADLLQQLVTAVQHQGTVKPQPFGG